MGSPLDLVQPPHCAGAVLCRWRRLDIAARLYQEDAEDPGGGFTDRCETDEKGAIMKKRKNPHIGGKFEDWLKEQGLYEETTSAAIKKVVAWQIQQAMEEQNLTRTEMARRMETSRVQLNRLLDPTNDGVTLATLSRAAAIVGRRLRLELV